MTLADLGNIGEFIASIGVLITLIYLAIQIRQNTDALKVQTRQALSETQFSNINLRATDPQLPMIIAKGTAGEPMTDEEQARFYYHCDASMRQFENAYSHYQAGMLSEPDWTAQRRSIVVSLRSELARDVWQRLKPTYNESFATIVDEALAVYEQPPGQPDSD